MSELTGTKKPAYHGEPVAPRILHASAAANQELWTKVILFGLLACAAALRLYQLGSGLWLDEIFTYTRYARLPYAQIITTFDSENQHFLYSLLAHTSLLIFGDHAWALRLPAALFGVASLGALYLFGREVTTRGEALLATALLTFSYHHIWFSQNARGYTGLLFFTLLSSWLLVMGMKRPGRGVWTAYAVAATLGMYTHMTMGFVIAGQFLVYLAGQLVPSKEQVARSWTGLVFGFLLAGLLTFLIHIPVIPGILATVGGTEVSVVDAWKSPLWTLMEIVRGLEIGFAGWAAGISALALFGAGVLSYAKSRPMVLGLLVLPVVLGAAIVLAIGHHLWPRFFFFAIGFAVLVVIRGVMAAAGLAASWLKIPQRGAWLGAALCAGLVLASAVSVPFAYGPKQDYEGALRYVESNRQPGDTVVLVGLAAPTFQGMFQTDWQEAGSAADLEEIRSQSSRTWVVYTFAPVLASVSPDIMHSLQQEFSVIKEFHGTVRGGEIIVSRSDMK